MKLLGGIFKWIKSFWREPKSKYMHVLDFVTGTEYVIDLRERDDGREEN